MFSGFNGSKVPVSVIIGITAVRYIFIPILGVLTIKYAVHFGFVDSESLYKFVLLLQFALPPAINIGLSNFSYTLFLRFMRSSIMSSSGNRLNLFLT